MRLFIAEKPSLARAIADVLPKPHRRGDGYIACGNNDVVTWCVGHLLEQAQPDAYDSRYARWSLADLPIIPEKWRLQPRPSVSKQLNAIKKLLLEADEVVHAGDPDREGQLLVDEVLDYLDLTAEKRQNVRRCLINDLNPQAVARAVERLRDNRDFIPLCVSALARSRADWLYGINMTRAYTLLGRNAGYDGVLSVGRVQTPVLGLVVRRDEEIENFVPKDFFEVKAHIVTPKEERFVALWQPSDSANLIRMKKGVCCTGRWRNTWSSASRASRPWSRPIMINGNQIPHRCRSRFPRCKSRRPGATTSARNRCWTFASGCTKPTN